LTDTTGQVIALTLPEAGGGPFSVMIGGQPGLFSTLSLHQPVLTNQHSLRIGGWEITWRYARRWNPHLILPGRSLQLSPEVADVVETYRLPVTNIPPISAVASLADHTVARLGKTVVHNIICKHSEGVKDTAAQLAGLGSGLTPAGDDYLLGVMAALYFAGRQTELLPIIAAAAAPRTTRLSAAFLRAAANGEFMESWHDLAQALFAGDAPAVAVAMARIAEFGLSSGREALAGFTSTLLAILETSFPSF
jgi:hypothetical protein